ncbi:hypothetical protein [Actinoplanes couchii]|uniref:SHOCT domain-containing protein n=1 Tax=Actinoplanes couchii TaxID=403638 RepID=A0ABQ3X1E4_9ACTN|nr:hypothetical protein [Actinoplanes couchii]MDR6316733.1 CBS domain containing-hemolysin-like protein [Actinoplanes couchii]GID52341.1 hypothetical protein Aco03nite_007450 [Actinoplanes couchii]
MSLREVVSVLVLLIAALGLIVAAALAFWPIRDGDGDRSARAAAEVDTHVQRWVPCSLEGVLASQLIAGSITRAQYLRALEQIAARDEQRAPFSLPRDEAPGTRS